MSHVLLGVNQVFRDLFDDDELVVDSDTTAADVPGWDSLMHVRLILGVEKAFQVRFMSSEIASLKKVGDLVALIDSKRKA